MRVDKYRSTCARDKRAGVCRALCSMSEAVAKLGSYLLTSLGLELEFAQGSLPDLASNCLEKTLPSMFTWFQISVQGDMRRLTCVKLHCCC